MYRPSPMLILVGLLAVPQLLAAWRHDSDARADAACYSVSIENRIAYETFYIGLVIFLAVMTHDLYNMIGAGSARGSSLHQIQ